MKYEKMRRGVFLSRPNRFVAYVELDGVAERCHVKNTGRCRELLVPGATVFVQEFDSAKRSTRFDLISVYKGDRLINMDSQAPNKIFREWLAQTDLFGQITRIQPEYSYGSSQLDFYLEAEGKRILVEVKGVTLEESGAAFFPDAPTQRGVKHLTELSESLGDGYLAYAVFIVQMEGVHYVAPNDVTHQAFGDALRRAHARGVEVLALDCRVTEDSIAAKDFVKVRLS